jgi:hypothetical protein
MTLPTEDLISALHETAAKLRGYEGRSVICEVVAKTLEQLAEEIRTKSKVRRWGKG